MKKSEEKIKVLFFGCWPPPYGGIASHLYELLPALSKRNIDVFLAVNLEEGNFDYKYDKGVHIFHYCHKKIFKKNFFSVIFYFFKFFLKKRDLKIRDFLIQVCHFVFIGKMIKEKSIQCIFTHDNPRILINPFLRYQFKNLNIFSTIYADFLISSKKYDKIKSYLKECFISSNLILSCSRFCVDTGKKYLNIDYPTRVIYNNVDHKIYTPKNDYRIRNKHGISKDSIILLTMCKMNHEMGIDFLLSIHKKILEIDDKIVLFFVGANDILSEKVIKLSKQNKRIYYDFNIPSKMKPYYFNSADIFTAPTLGSHACMGIANIEAMMSGVPVISSDSGGHRETIKNNHDGFIIPLTKNGINENEYLNCLKKLVIDDQLRKKIAVRTRKRALRLFTNKRNVDVHLEIINEFTQD